MKYPAIIQASEEDCGATCLATIAKYYGRSFNISRIREAVGTTPKGTTLLGLRRGAEKLGFNTRSAKAPPEVLDQLDEISLPAIISWKGYHYVVLYGKRRNKYIISDPAVGLRYIDRGELSENWFNYLILILEPDPIRFAEQEEDKVSGVRRFIKRVLPYKKILLEVLVLNIVLGLLSLALPFFIQILTDDVLIRGDREILQGLAISVIAMIIISQSLSFIQANLIAQFGQRIQLGLVLEFGRKLLRLPLNYYEARSSGEIVNRLQDIEKIDQLISQVAVSLPSEFFIALISLGVMFFYSWKLTLLVLVLTTFALFIIVVFLPTLQQRTRQSLVLESENQGFLVETFKGALTLKIINAYFIFWEKLQSRFGRVANTLLDLSKIRIIYSSSTGLVSGISEIALLWYGSTLVINQELSIGQLLAFKTMSEKFEGFVSSLINIIDDFIEAKVASQRLSEVIDHRSEEEITDNKPFVTISEQDDIIFKEINFYYSGRDNLLENFSITIKGGKTTAIIGKSGCGKSSLAKLLTGLHIPQSGNISFGNYSLDDLALESVREQVILIPQDAHFWSRSIYDNFRLASPTTSFDEIVNACKIAQADEFIQKLPYKYQTVLGEYGANISGGEKQRLAIARAILNDPSILILDESTGALDPVSEAEVLDNLLRSRQGKTTILISHRPKVIQQADQIIYLEQGQLRQQGNLEEIKSTAGKHLDFLV